MPAPELPELCVRDARRWRAWLHAHHAQPNGVWLVLAKKGTAQPTSLTYPQALEEAICYGWIDGQIRRRDDATYATRFTPRRPRSAWSANNVALVQRLTAEGRMHAAGLAAAASAQADGRWERAYAAQSAATIPDDLAAALAANPAAAAAFPKLTSANRFAVLYRVQDAKRAETRARRIDELVAMLARGETPHPQRRALQD